MTIDLVVLKDIVIGIASVITAFGVISIFLKKYFDKMVGRITEPILSRINEMDKNQCMNYLTEFLADIRNGAHKSEYQRARAHEVYNHYQGDLHGNSYIKENWDKYMRGDNQ